MDRHRVMVPYPIQKSCFFAPTERIRLIGDSADWWFKLRDLLKEQPPTLPYEMPSTVPIEVLTAGVVKDHDHVVFFSSAPNGITASFDLALAQCSERTIIPVAIILTEVEAVDDPSLRELVKVEVWDRMARIMPADLADRLPLFYDTDPDLGFRLRAIILDKPHAIKCATFSDRRVGN